MTAPPTIQDDVFSNFVHDTFDTLHRFAARMCQDETLAKDLVQESYIKIMRAHHGEVDKLNIGYANRTLSRLIIDNSRKETRERRKIGAVGRLEVERLAADPGKQVADHAYRVWLSDDLTPQQQEILFLTASGFTAAEVGGLLGMASGTVSNYLSIIRKRLRKRRSEN